MKALAIAKHMLPFTRYPYRGRLVPCPVCEAAEFRPIARLDRRMKRLPTVMCDACGLLFTNPMPTDEELDHYYSRYYRFDYQLALSKPSGTHVHKREQEVVRRLDTFRDLVPAGGRTLDFGAGSGELVAGLLAEGFDAHGFEPGEDYGGHARRKLGDRIKIAGWRDMRFSGEFDLVTCFHVVEHLNAPVEAISAMASWIKPGGKVLVEVPNMASPINKGIGGLHFAHVLSFNTYNLRLAGAKAGLRMVRKIAPTMIVFEKGEAQDAARLARKGLALARANYVEAPPVSTYLRYQLRKVSGRAP